MTEYDKDNEIMQFFECDHLPAFLQKVSTAFGVLAYRLENGLVPSEERSVALRKLLEAKDAAVRARLIDTRVTTEGI